ncbi:MAG: cell envelope integrity protein CreD [Pseudomonadales bacterium]|nr:cell envelope integrity protein CreD [Pseudomonadales bacterium]
MQKQLAIKVAVILIIGLALLIPINMVDSKVQERETYQAQAEHNVASSWTGSQTLMTPVLVIPYHLKVNNSAGFYTAESVKALERSAVITPKTLSGNGIIKNKSVFKGIYEVQVYNGSFSFSGTITTNQIQDKVNELKSLANFEAFETPFIAIHLSDMRGISKAPSLTINEKPITLNPGSGIAQLGDGIHASMPDLISNQRDLDFEFELPLRGMGEFSLIQMADSAQFTLDSDWPHPEFIGASLPEERNISSQGFDAAWFSNRYSSNASDRLNQCIDTSNCSEFIYSASGVNFIDPVDIYLQSERSIKYAMLFIGLSFVTFFLLEHIKKIRIHPIQYAFVGFAIAVFYLLLISFAEHIAFGIAYLISTMACSGLILVYTRHILKSASIAVLFGGMILTLYGVLYVIVQAEDFAQLMGAILIFILLSALMITTRKLDWYSLDTDKLKQQGISSGSDPT